MSDVMLLGVLRMPYDMAMHDEISRLQYHSRGMEAAARIEADADEIARLRADVERLTASLSAEVTESERLRAALAEERRHADDLADVLYCMDGLQRTDCEMRDNTLAQHRTRRQP